MFSFFVFFLIWKYFPHEMFNIYYIYTEDILFKKKQKKN